MSEWTSGYVTDVGYTHGYYSELNPARAAHALLHAGIVPPTVTTACELGFGQGLSVNVHAAAGAASWHANDFNPAQAAYAKSLAAISGSGADLTDEAFAEFCARPDLPEFDFIGVHGIWTWINDDNRRVIVDFARRKLKLGGVLYISYNTLPGWAAFAPMRHLLTEYTGTMTGPGSGMIARITDAIDFADKLIATNPTYVRANSQVAERLKGLHNQNKNYLAHEYFNRNWNAMYFAEMADWLAPAKVEFACSAHLLENLDVINLTTEQQALLNDIPDPMFRQTVRDYCFNQQFRRDYWVKGPRRLNALQQAEALRAARVMLAVPRADVTMKATGALGEADLTENIYAPILDVLADHLPRTVAEIEQAVKAKDVNFAQLVQAMLVLIGKGDVAPVQPLAIIKKAKTATAKFNAHLIDLARASADINYLASPVTGSGLKVGRVDQLFLLAIKEGKKQPAEWAAFTWRVLASQRQKLIKGGKTLETADDNIAELTTQASAFAEKSLPVLQALQIP